MILRSCVLAFCSDDARNEIRDLRSRLGYAKRAMSFDQYYLESDRNLGEPLRIQRKVVLLTEDRALKIKALSKNVPVRTIPSFVDWAGIP